jgi:anti-sigma B factor antagonist
MTEIQLDDTGTLKLFGEVTISTAQDLYSQLAAISADDHPMLTIDLSGLTQLDTAGVQLLLAFRRSASLSRVHSCPAPLREFVRQIGLELLFL